MIGLLRTALAAAALTFGAGSVSAATADFAIDVTDPAGTLSVEAGGTPFVLDLGKTYLVTISGQLKFSRQENLFADAEYKWGVDRGGNVVAIQDRIGQGPANFDIGVTLDGAEIDWGPFDTSHVYSTLLPGTGAQLRVAFLDAAGAYGDNRESTLRATIAESVGGGPTLTPVPLPAGLPLMAAGLGALGMLRLRRRR
jgi:hypothetical protein